MGRAYTPAQWDAWTAKMKAAHGNGNGHGRSLSIEALRMVDAVGAYGRYTPAVRRWEHVTRPAPPATDDDGRLAVTFVEWMMGMPAGWVTDLDLTRAQMLRLLGNSVVPQQAAHAVGVMLTERARALMGVTV